MKGHDSLSHLPLLPRGLVSSRDCRDPAGNPCWARGLWDPASGSAGPLAGRRWIAHAGVRGHPSVPGGYSGAVSRTPATAGNGATSVVPTAPPRIRGRCQCAVPCAKAVVVLWCGVSARVVQCERVGAPVPSPFCPSVQNFIAECSKGHMSPGPARTQCRPESRVCGRCFAVANGAELSCAYSKSSR